jgi:hypothetical protein
MNEMNGKMKIYDILVFIICMREMEMMERKKVGWGNEERKMM